MSQAKLRIAVLFSGSGSTLQNLIDATRDGRLPDTLVVRAVSSREDALGIERCRAANVPCFVVPRKNYPAGDAGADAFSEAVFQYIHPAEVDLICMAGWMNLLKLPEHWKQNRVMNIHPSLLPAFGGRGMFGRRVHEAVLARGCKVTGCTVHYVNDECDEGPIIAQRCVQVEERDTPDTLADRVQAMERTLYPQVIAELQPPHNRA